MKKYLHRDAELGYRLTKDPYEPVALETLEQVEPFEYTKEQVGNRELFEITLDDGTTLKLCKGTLIHVLRDGVKQWITVESLEEGDEIIQ